MSPATPRGKEAPGPRVLILKPSSLGDVIHALPVLRLIKAHLPASKIHWWIDSSLAGLLRDDQDLEGLVIFERRRWATAGNLAKLCRDVIWMRRQRFDWVIDLQSLARSGTIAWLANGKLSIGLDTPREGARGYYDIAVRRPGFHTHAVDWYLEALKWVGVPRNTGFQWLPEREGPASAIRRQWAVAGSRHILIQPGARWLNKRWPIGHYADLVRSMAQTHPDHTFALLGGKEDALLTREIAERNPGRCLDLAGKLSLAELVEWIRAGDLMITNDTGPMHIAAALGKPVVALFGPTEPRRTGPYGQLANVIQLNLPCVPCMRQRCRYFKPLECLRALPPSLVGTAAAKLLQELQLPWPTAFARPQTTN